MPENVIITYKNQGETPLESLEKVRKEHSISADIPMTYAGRLDPMAEGVMILLVGEECKNKDQYLGLDKTYKFEILVGFETDTYDLLGKVASSEDKISGPLEKTASLEMDFGRSSDLPTEEFDGRGQTIPKSISSFAYELESFVGTFIQKYPSFSSKTIGGKQLFQLSKDDELPEDLPEHEVAIHKLELISQRTVTKDDLQKDILERLSKVHGDFRQEDIKAKWNEVFKQSAEAEYTIVSCVAECSSGTYIRQLVSDISDKIGLPLVTYSIKRTKVGNYTK